VGKTTLKTESLTILLYSPYCLKWGALHLRHSKAMHLLQANVNLIYIRDFLGHSSVTTTERYAKADSEIKRKAIERASYNFLPDKKYISREKNELLAWLRTII
jgi:integrase/recombinase XerD